MVNATTKNPPNLYLRIGLRFIRLFTSASLVAWLILLLFLLMILWMVGELRTRDMRYAQQQFDIQLQEVIQTIEQRMKAHEQILTGAAALFDASDAVSRYEWQTYISRLELPRYFPGIQAVAFARVIRPEDLQSHVQAMRAEGFSDYQLRPEGIRKLYTSIDYIEPFSGRNLAAFGYDMFSEPVRRAAMSMAVNEDATRISDRVTLVQENRGRVQPGLLMYIPIYDRTRPVATAEERWAALQGFVYSAYRMEDLMQGILGQRNLNIHFDIYSAPAPEENALLYRSHADASYTADPLFKQTLVINVYGREWTLVFTKEREILPSVWFRLDQLVLILGASISLLLFLLISFLANERQRARFLANRMTEDIQQNVQALRLSEERFRLALDSSSMGTWNWYLAENAIHWDESIYPLFGLSANHSLNTYESFLALLHPDDRARVFQEIASAMEGHVQYDTEYRIIWPDGSLHYIASRAKVLHSENHKPLLMTGTCWDITERKQIERMKNEFVSMVSHELRTPLTSINGAIGLLASGALDDSPEKTRQLIDMAYKNSQRLGLLIDDLLDMEKLSNGKIVYDMAQLPLVPLVKRALAENQIYADQYQITYRLQTELAVASVTLDATRFLQVMANLLSNAAKFSNAGNEVVVEIISLSEQWVRIAVIDQGIGIPAAEQAFIFEKFYQVDGSDKRKKGGTGLGLAITKIMVEQMNGKLGLESQEGVGSTFYVDLPLAPEQ